MAPLFSVITPSYNSGLFLEETICSVLAQQGQGIEIEYIVIDGGSTDNSLDIIEKYKNDISWYISEPDRGPAHAINKGLARARGDIVSWLNADDVYCPGSLRRVAAAFQQNPDAAFYFGSCPVSDSEGREIRQGITRFKEAFFPVSSRFVYQCINYISQPATFFRGDVVRRIGPLREDMVAAWDYDFFLRLWREGTGQLLSGTPLASFRWHEASISGQNFSVQFQEEYELAKEDAGRYSLQTFLHYFVRWGIVGAYLFMEFRRNRKQ